jgi:GNAT superfamily N-acetyltransferase
MSSVLQLAHSLAIRPPRIEVPGVSLRTFSQADPGEDVDRWLELRRQAFARERLGVRHWDRNDFQQEMLGKQWWHAGRTWLAEVDTAVDTPDEAREHLIGAVTLAMRGTGEAAVPVVHWLIVRPPWRRRGVGRMLMATLEAECWDQGFRQVRLETHAGWRRAVQFYERLGYQVLP